MKLSALRLLVLSAFLALPSAYAQQLQREVLSIVSIENVAIVDPQTMEFTLTLRRTSNVWERWANGTFQFQIVGVASSRYTPECNAR